MTIVKCNNNDQNHDIKAIENKCAMKKIMKLGRKTIVKCNKNITTLCQNVVFMTRIACNNYHYEKLCPLKPHYSATKTQKTIRRQLLCNYPLGITTIV